MDFGRIDAKFEPEAVGGVGVCLPHATAEFVEVVGLHDHFAVGDADEARQASERLMDRAPLNRQIVDVLESSWALGQKDSAVIERLEQERAAHPYNFAVVSSLISRLGEAGNSQQAVRDLDALRAAFIGDAELL